MIDNVVRLRSAEKPVGARTCVRDSREIIRTNEGTDA